MPDAACSRNSRNSVLLSCLVILLSNTIPTAHLHGFTRGVGLLSTLRLRKVEGGGGRGGELLMPVLWSEMPA